MHKVNLSVGNHIYFWEHFSFWFYSQKYFNLDLYVTISYHWIYIFCNKTPQGFTHMHSNENGTNTLVHLDITVDPTHHKASLFYINKISIVYPSMQTTRWVMLDYSLHLFLLLKNFSQTACWVYKRVKFRHWHILLSGWVKCWN